MRLLTPVLLVVWSAHAAAATSPAVVDTRDELASAPQDRIATQERPPAAATGHRPSSNPLWAIPLRSLTATRERPLFAPSRRAPARAVASAPPPVPKPTVPKKAPEPEKLQISLVGTITGAEGIAVFLDGSTKAILSLKTGDSHKGWTLRTVERGEVSLARGSQTKVLALPPPQTQAAAAPPLAAAPPVPSAPAIPLSRPAANAAPAADAAGETQPGRTPPGALVNNENTPPGLAAILFQPRQVTPPAPKANPFRSPIPQLPAAQK
ncbi:MAG TPA: hypothetical protein VNR11_05880 [Xanthobacteraceae bacterium]|nr:hypothetical protein [Xanthobacteraceae bacterium]